MSTDDRDIESSNPSKNFKVGDFDQRSGFFTPVWESKRRIRSEPPGPPSSAGGGRANRTSSPPPGEADDASTSAAGTPASKSKGGKSARSTSGSKSRRASARSATPVPPAPSEGTPATLVGAPLPPAVAAVFDPAVALEPVADAGSSQSQSDAAAPGAHARASHATPAESSAASSPAGSSPAGSSPADSSSAGSGRPSAAARALRDAGPNLPPAAFLDAEPEFRGTRDARARREPSSERTDRSPVHQRSLRATSAAARVHEQLKAKLQAEAAELDESRFDRTPDSQLPPLPSRDQENELYPQSLMRRLRRTIRLSTPVPDRIRSLISKYDRG